MIKSYTLNTLPDYIWAAFMASTVDPDYDYLNELLEDEAFTTNYSENK